MSTSVRVLLVATMVGVALVNSACGDKTSDPQAQTQTATLSGQISPAGSVTTVTATDASGKANTTAPGTTGAYSFSALAVGAYTLSFTPAAGYTTPASVAVTLGTSGTTAPATTLTTTRAAASFQVDATAVTAAYVFSQTLAGDRFLTFTVSPGGAPGPTVHIDIPGLVPVVGSYPLDNDDYNASYLGADYTSYYSAKFGRGSATSGTLTITSVDPTQRRFAGTFTFLGTDATSSAPSGALPVGTPLTRNITKGVFTSVPY